MSALNFFYVPETWTHLFHVIFQKYIQASTCLLHDVYLYTTCLHAREPRRTDLLFLRKSLNKGTWLYLRWRRRRSVCVFFESSVYTYKKKKKWKFSTLAHCLTVNAEHLAFIVAFWNTHTHHIICILTCYVPTLRVHPSFPIVVFLYYFLFFDVYGVIDETFHTQFLTTGLLR